MKNTTITIRSVIWFFITLVALLSSQNSFGLSSNDSQQKALDVISKNWFPLTGQEEKSHFLFRTEISADNNRKPVLAITAGSVYRLYINGEWVMDGPARAITEYFFVDFLELDKWLTKGKNTIALEVAYYPNHVPQKIQYEFPRHSPGVGLCIFIDGKKLTLSEKWKYHKLEAFTEHAPWTRGLRGEEVIASKYPTGWMTTEFDDSKWKPIRSEQLVTAPAGLKQRPIPLPFTDERLAERITDFGFLEFPEKYKTEPIPEHLLRWMGGTESFNYGSNTTGKMKTPDELDRVQYRKVCNAVSGSGLVSNPGALLERNNKEPLKLKGRKGRSSYVVYDLGENSSGHVYIETTIPEGARLDVNLTEWMDNASGAPSDNKQRLFNPMVSHGGFTIIGDGQAIQYTNLIRNNFRYIILVARGLKENQQIAVNQLELKELGVIHESDIEADVICSNPVLNKIVDACKRTIRINAHDGYVDCTCERIVTSGDCLQSSDGGRLFYGDVGNQISENMFNLFIEQGTLANEEYPNMLRGRCSAVTKGEEERNMLWMLAPAMFILDMIDWANENHSPLPDKYINAILGVTRDIKNNLTHDGLIPFEAEMHNWSDWSKMVVGAEDGISISVNAFYYRTFRECATILSEYQVFNELADKIQSGLRPLCARSINSSNERVSRFVPDMFVRVNGSLQPFRVDEAHIFHSNKQMVSETTQNWLLWSGVLTREQEQRLWDVLRGWNSFDVPVRDNTRMLNPSRSSSVMGLFPRYTYMAEIKDPKIYQNMVETFGPNVLWDKTLWESLEVDTRSSAHATTAYTGVVLHQCLTGILPGENSTSYRIEPVIDDELEWARGYKKTANGYLGVSWRRGAHHKFTLSVTVPRGIEVSIKLPEQVTGYLVANGHEIPKDGIYVSDISTEIVADRFSGVNIREIILNE